MKRVPRRRAPASRKPSAISIRVEDPAWRRDPTVRGLIRRAVRLALTAVPLSQALAGKKPGTSFALTILLTDDSRLRALNAAFRGKDKPTNVLSFPADATDAAYLGDIAIAFGVVQREARAQGKNFAAHAAHLAAHGTLHLLGYDHEKAKDAEGMEALETAILARLGVADPYAPGPYTGGHKAA